MESGPSHIDIYKMFDRIAGRYDLLNGILSFGLDSLWRRSAAKYLKPKNSLEVLDLATGTGDLLISLISHQQNIRHAVGIDMSENMLTIAKKKIGSANLSDRITLIRADTARIPFADNSFDAVTIAFGIRNMPDIDIILKEMYRVLRPSGTALILEFALPEKTFLRKLFLFYLRNIVPFVGGVISGNRNAYRYLNQTIETFPFGEDFCNIMRKAGFANTKTTPLTFGIACLYTGDKTFTQNC